MSVVIIPVRVRRERERILGIHERMQGEVPFLVIFAANVPPPCVLSCTSLVLIQFSILYHSFPPTTCIHRCTSGLCCNVVCSCPVHLTTFNDIRHAPQMSPPLISTRHSNIPTISCIIHCTPLSFHCRSVGALRLPRFQQG